MTRTVDVPAKPLWASWTFWINLLSALAMAIEAITVQNLLPSPWNERALALLAVVNILLRIRTTQPVALTSGQTRTVTSGPGATSGGRNYPPMMLLLLFIPALLFALAFDAFLVALALGA